MPAGQLRLARGNLSRRTGEYADARELHSENPAPDSYRHPIRFAEVEPVSA
jgi:hypothetical protein